MSGQQPQQRQQQQQRQQPKNKQKGQGGEPEVFKSARGIVNTAKGDINIIKDALKKLWAKVNCPAGKTKPAINLNLPSDGKQASDNANIQITTLKNACGYQNSTSSTTPATPAAQITLVDISTLKQRFTTLFRTIKERLSKVDTDITTLKIGKNTLKQIVDEYDPIELKDERGRNFTTRYFDLETKVSTLESEVNQILDFAQKGAPKDGTPYLNEYYRSLLAVQSVLTGSVSTDTRSKEFPGAKESKERIKEQAADILSKLTTLELDVKMVQRKKGETVEAPGKYTSFTVNYITNTDLRNVADINEYLTSTNPYYYFDMETPPQYKVGNKINYTSAPGVIETGTIASVVLPTPPSSKNTKGTLPKYKITLDAGTSPSNPVEEATLTLQDPTLLMDGYTVNEVYRNIKAVNGYGCLQILENHEEIINAFDNLSLTEDKFVFVNDLCKYLFKLPSTSETFSYKTAIGKGDFKKQVPILAIIHHLHFIGTLIKYKLKKEASIGDIDSTISARSYAKERLDNARKDIDKFKEEIKEYEPVLKEFTDDYNAAKEAIKRVDPLTSDKSEEEEEVEDDINYYETIYNNVKTQIKDHETSITELKKKRISLEATLDLASGESDASREILIELGNIKNDIELHETHIDELNENRIDSENILISLLDYYSTEDEEELEDFDKIDGVEYDEEIPIPVSLAVFKKRDFFKRLLDDAQEEMNKINADLTAATADFDKFNKEYSTVSAKLTGIETQYGVPEFRVEKLDIKYKYARDFSLNKELKISLDDIVKNIYRSIHDTTFPLQTLNKVQEMMKYANILPAPGVPEAKALTMPGTVGSLTPATAPGAEARMSERFEKLDMEELNQKGQLIIQLGGDFVSTYRPSIKAEIIAKRPAAKKNDPFSIEELDLMIESTKASLPPAPAEPVFPKYKWDKAQQEYSQLKDLLSEYERKSYEIKSKS
jgi:archaellum component FlaC